MTTHIQDASRQLIPLNKLKKSPKNVRKVPHTQKHIKSLAASITAHGQLQEIVVEPERDTEGNPTGSYLVNVGEGRRLAQCRRAKEGKIAPDAGIPCLIDSEHDARAVSLAENVIRDAMHPADQFEAFRQLIDAGRSIEDVAAEFSVSPLVVQRRLKLANVCPEFLTLYRQGDLKLEQLMAFAVTDDHELQRTVWNSLRDFDRDPQSLRRALTREEVSSRSPIARFVGQAYQKAGGQLRRDLFSEEHESFLVDRELLSRLATEKLERHAARLRTEGFPWVEVRLRPDYAELAKFGRVETVLREASEKEQHRLAEIERERSEVRESIERVMESDGESAPDDTRVEELENRAETLDDEEEEITEARRVPNPAHRAIAGAVVYIDHDGTLAVERCVVKPEDKKRLAGESVNGAAGRSVSRVHSAALLRRLSAQRSMALRATLTQRMDVAIVSLTHRLACRAFFPTAGIESPVHISSVSTALRQYDSDLDKSKAHLAIEAQRKTWKGRLPASPQELACWLLAQPQSEVLSLLSFCIALTVDAVQSEEGASPLDEFARAAGLDMREWWTATAVNYFGSVPKSRVLSVVAEATAPETAARLEKLKKSALAAEAEKHLAGTGWLPGCMCGADA
jgi:ParB family chromosome partitioning protein